MATLAKIINTSRTPVLREQNKLTKLDHLEQVIAGFLSLNKISTGNRVISYPRSDLPLLSDFGEVNTPYDLIYARLEGLQYT